MIKVSNPLTAGTLSLNPMSIAGYILWVVLAWFIVGIGQKVKTAVENKLPMLDGTIEPITRQQTMATVQSTNFY